ncbi:MAG: hypothetical protein LBO62_06960, partial [Endomicrobium sp.]|nr:hypothetical protein [Endomicrobium sp.]
MKKIVSVIVLFSFLISILFPPQVFASNYDADADAFGIPSSLGKITASKYYGGGEIVINIQDLHCHAQAQRNISAILGRLEEKYGLKETYLEGTFGQADTSSLTSVKNGRLDAALEVLLESGYLSGAEYY